ncbi:hypothetical protein F966_01188 [Acinetobacter higginsii]|uniref:CMP/dCMP-type deaminase domain-containing protein n=1 Tax=Acinetobacter higginsii TaxID=70347 RepID=N8WDN9_9GAMM|nr:hypothetical protein [Acinetobacter higginsii]ENV10016.1 hypothetical protein F966_01188 [Acinetobacter higginsii]
MEQKLFQAAKVFMESHYPKGWGGVVALATESGKILISVAPETRNDALSLCMEVGACSEAHKIHEKITHSLCICRASEHSNILILTPCGIC